MTVQKLIETIKNYYHGTQMDIIHMLIFMIFGLDNYQTIVTFMCNSFSNELKNESSESFAKMMYSDRYHFKDEIISFLKDNHLNNIYTLYYVIHCLPDNNGYDTFSHIKRGAEQQGCWRQNSRK